MARVTNAELLERVEALEAELEELRSVINTPTPQVQLVKEILPPSPISYPLDVQALARGTALEHSSYYEDGDDYRNRGYL